MNTLLSKEEKIYNELRKDYDFGVVALNKILTKTHQKVIEFISKSEFGFDLYKNTVKIINDKIKNSISHRFNERDDARVTLQELSSKLIFYFTKNESKRAEISILKEFYKKLI